MKSIRFCSALFIFHLACTTIWAQATAQISGTVKDQSGAVLPGVEVTATNTDTGISRTTVTNETGSYVLPNLALGPYRLEAALPGFRTFAQTGLVLQVNSSPVINAVLEVGQVTEQVEVQANAAMVETRTSGIGQVIENQRILDLPLNGRNVTDLITLSGAAVDVGAGNLGGRDFGGAPRLQIAGGQTTAVGYSLDGANYTNFMNISGLPMPFPDALQEFKVETSGVTAQTGNAAGVSAVTKSGTNEIHGDLFEFVRNDLFNARSYFATKGSTLKRNQFGGTVGGPIRKNRLFFFGGYQGTTIRRDPADAQAFIPTAAMFAGDWTAFAAPACNAGRALALRAPFTNNRIDPAQYSRAAVNLVNRVLAQAPKPANECGLVTYGAPSSENDWQTIGRIDYQWTDKHSVFGRYTATHLFQPLPFGITPDNVLNSAAEGNDNLVQSYAFGDTYLLTPNVVNAFRLSANRMFNRQLGASDSAAKFWTACDVGINMYCADTPGRMRLAVTSGFTIGTTHDQRDAVWINAFYVSDDVSVIRGTHQMSFGGSLGLQYSGVRDHYWGTGQFVINGQTTGHGLADLMTGRVSAYTDSAPFYFSTRAWAPRLYGSDTWKVNSNWTVSYGVRWDPFLPQISPAGQIANFDHDRFLKGIKSTVYPVAPAGAYYPGDPGFPGKSGTHNRWGLFAPRVGLAWDVTSDGRTSVRASYSLAYAVVGSHWYETPAQSAPWGYTTAVVGTSLDDPWSVFPGGNPFPVIPGKTYTPFAEFYSTPYELHTPYTSSWNLSIQRQVASAWLVSAAYLGSQTIHAWWGQTINPATYFPQATCTINGVTYTPCSSTANTNQRRRFSLENPQEGRLIGNAAQVDDGGTGNYHGLLLTLQRRVARGVSVNSNYTWSHCIGDTAVDLTNNNNGNNIGYNDLNNRRFDRGNCNGDRRQIFNLTALVQTPRFENSTLRKVASGWSLSGIYRRTSGSPLDVLIGSDRALTGIQNSAGGTNQRAQQISDARYSDQSGRPLTNWLNRAAFDLPALGTLGNVSRNALVGPPTWSFDMSLSREFRLREAQRLEFRLEAFNLTNSFRPGNPTSTLTSAQFGQIRTSLDPRILQFALKFVF